MCFVKVFLLVAVLATACAEECPSQYLEISPTHTMCLNDIGTEIPLTQADKDAILEQHNMYRQQAASPPAADMVKIVWDEDLARTAAKWSRQCKFAHDSPAHRAEPSLPGVWIGQNGAIGFLDLVKATIGWAREIENFTYGVKDDRLKGHYVQVITGQTSRLGCGIASCTNTRFSRIMFCNYAPGVGSYVTPYKESTGGPCSECPNNCDVSGKLCDCMGKVCMNRGNINVTTCTCQCAGAWTGDTCSDKLCKGADESSCQYYLGKGYSCSLWWMYEMKCAYTCGFCP